MLGFVVPEVDNVSHQHNNINTMRRSLVKKQIPVLSLIGFTTLIPGVSYAGVLPTVPEIDGGVAAIAIGLTLGVVALIREHRRRK